MATKPKFAAAPKPPALTAEQAAFIDKGRGKDRAEPGEALKRISIDLPRSLHARFKAACALAETKMLPEIVDYIERRTAELEEQNRKP